MVDDEYQLFGEQPGIDRVADISCPADAVIGFKMSIVVPADRCDSISVSKTKSIKRTGQLFGPGKTFSVRISMTWVVRSYRHDLATAVILRAVLRNR